MFTGFSFYRRAVSLLLPFVFLWAWAGCLTLCAETVTHHEDSFAASSSAVGVESECLDSCCSEGCSIKTMSAALQERRSFSVLAFFNESASVLSFQQNAYFSTKFASIITFHSPPEIVFPRFLRLQNFRL